MCTVEAFSRVLQSVSSTSESLWLWLWYKAYRRYHRCPAELTVLTVLTVLRVERREIVHFCSPPKSSVIFLSFCFPSCLYSASETDSSAGSCLNLSQTVHCICDTLTLYTVCGLILCSVGLRVSGDMVLLLLSLASVLSGWSEKFHRGTSNLFQR